MKRIAILGLVWAVFVMIVAGCSKNDVEDDPASQEPSVSNYNTSERVNKFIVDCVQRMYLWESETDWTLYKNYNTYSEPAYQGALSNHTALFERFIYQDDGWSTLTDNIDEMESNFGGVSTTYGYNLIFGKYSDANAYFAIVLYVVPDSPAEKVGIQRGDVIQEMNNGYITADNYTDLYYSSSITLGMGKIKGNVIENTGTVRMTAVKMYENPILEARVIDKGAHKIGYLCYTGYQMESEPELVEVFKTFKNSAVTDVVLDLRYNGGGYARTSQILSSILAPATAVSRKELYLSHKWNDLWMSVYDDEDVDEYFIDTLSVNMDLKRLYVLTSGSTASASEATIIGLQPYLNVVLVGETTSGKYCGGALMDPKDFYQIFPEKQVTNDYLLNISNWGMYIMIYRYANKNNYPTFTTGLPPQIEVAENHIDLKPLGDESEPLLRAALAEITGEVYTEKRSAQKTVPVTWHPELRVKRPIEGKLIYTRPLR